MKFGLNLKRKNVFEQEEEKTSTKVPVLKDSKIDKKTIEILSQAIEEDADIFDYDKAYDSFSTTRERKKEKEKEKREARYIHGLIQASNKRKIDLEIALEKKIQREREEEGLIFKDKEKFVTQAYLDKQQELARLEKEEKEREERERTDMSGFYRKILDDRTVKVQEVVEEQNVGKDVVVDEKSVAIKEAIAAGQVVLNDSEEIVDKRLYLKGGLNFTKKAESLKLKQNEKDKIIQERRREEEREEERKKRELILASKRRAELNAQKSKVVAQKETEKVEALESLKKASESSVTESKIQDARARYLERKKLKDQ